MEACQPNFADNLVEEFNLEHLNPLAVKQELEEPATCGLADSRVQDDTSSPSLAVAASPTHPFGGQDETLSPLSTGFGDTDCVDLMDDLNWINQTVQWDQVLNLSPREALETLTNDPLTAPEIKLEPDGTLDDLDGEPWGRGMGREEADSELGGLSDYELMTLPVKALNKRLQGFAKEDVMKLKQKRRTLKNRGYAQNCRTRRIKQKQHLETDNMTLQEQVDHLRRQVACVSRERDMYKRRCEVMSLGHESSLFNNTREGSLSSAPSSPDSVFSVGSSMD